MCFDQKRDREGCALLRNDVDKQLGVEGLGITIRKRPGAV